MLNFNCDSTYKAEFFLFQPETCEMFLGQDRQTQTSICSSFSLLLYSFSIKSPKWYHIVCSMSALMISTYSSFTVFKFWLNRPYLLFYNNFLF